MIRCALSSDWLNCFLGMVPWYVYALFAGAALLLVWVLYDKIKGIFRGIVKWGGWRAGVAAALVVGGVLLSLWPRKHVSTEEDHFPHPDPKPIKIKKPRPTINLPTLKDLF